MVAVKRPGVVTQSRLVHTGLCTESKITHTYCFENFIDGRSRGDKKDPIILNGREGSITVTKVLAIVPNVANKFHKLGHKS